MVSAVANFFAQSLRCSFKYCPANVHFYHTFNVHIVLAKHFWIVSKNFSFSFRSPRKSLFQWLSLRRNCIIQTFFFLYELVKKYAFFQFFFTLSLGFIIFFVKKPLKKPYNFINFKSSHCQHLCLFFNLHNSFNFIAEILIQF